LVTHNLAPPLINPFFCVNEAFAAFALRGFGRRRVRWLVVFWGWLHYRTADLAAWVGEHQNIRRDAAGCTATGACNFNLFMDITDICGHRVMSAKNACGTWVFRVTDITDTVF